MHSIIVTGIWFSASHRVEGHPKCSRLHGHNYQVSFEISSQQLDDMQFVVDFGEVKAVAKEVIDKEWDHRYLVGQRNIRNNDIYYRAAMDEIMTRDDLVLLDIEQTTAESLARLLAERWALEFWNRWKVTLLWVEVQETPTSSARYYAIPGGV